MPTYNESGSGGMNAGEWTPIYTFVQLIKPTTGTDCNCCATNFFPYDWGNPASPGTTALPIPQTMTWSVPSLTGTCADLSDTMTAYPTAITIGNSELATGHEYGMTYVFQNPVEGGSGYQGGIQVFTTLLLNLGGTYWTGGVSVPLGFQNLSYTTTDWDVLASSNTLATLTGVPSSFCPPTYSDNPTCSGNLTVNDTGTNPTVIAGGFPGATTIQWDLSYTSILSAPGASGTFSGETLTSGFYSYTFTADSSGTITIAGVGSGSINYSAGTIEFDFDNSEATYGVSITYEVSLPQPGNVCYPSSVVIELSEDSISCGCLTNGNFCKTFLLDADADWYDSDSGVKILSAGRTTLSFVFQHAGCQCAWDQTTTCCWFNAFPADQKVASTSATGMVILVDNQDGSATLMLGLAGEIDSTTSYQYIEGYVAPTYGQDQTYTDGSDQTFGGWNCSFQESFSFTITDFDCTCVMNVVDEDDNPQGLTLFETRGS
jgi:hypothetical protein